MPVRRGFWGNKLGKPHTVPTKVTGKCGSIWVRLIPAPRGTGIVSAPVPKKLLQMAGIEDCYTSAKGSTGTLGNFGELAFHLASLLYGVVHLVGYLGRVDSNLGHSTILPTYSAIDFCQFHNSPSRTCQKLEKPISKVD